MCQSVHLVLLLLVIMSTGSVVSYTPAGCQGYLDVVFIMDQSESIRESSPFNNPDQNWNIFKDFIKDLVTGLPVSQGVTKTALIKYSTKAQVVWHLDTYSAVGDIYQAITNLGHEGGNTNTTGALKMAREEVFVASQGDRDAKNIVILMTDGLSTSNNVWMEADLLQTQSKAEIYVVAIGKYIDENELRLIANDFSKNIILVDGFNQLEYIKKLLLHRLCEVPEFQPNITRPSDCNQLLDLALIVDNSGSVAYHYSDLKMFLANVIAFFEVGYEKTRVGVVRFSDDAQVAFQLNQYYNKKDIQDTILNMPLKDGETNTSGGIRETVQKVFSGSPGDRPHVCNVALLITDGVSTIEKSNTLKEAENAKQQNIEFFVVGVTRMINKQELQSIASRPAQNHFFDSTAVRYLNQLIIRIGANICATKC